MLRWKLLLTTLPFVAAVLFLVFLRDAIFHIPPLLDFSDTAPILTGAALGSNNLKSLNNSLQNLTKSVSGMTQGQRSLFLRALLLCYTNCSGKFFVGHCSSASLAGHLGRSHLRKLLFRGMVPIPVTMRWLALGPQAALFIDSRLFIPMLHILLLRTL